MSTSSNRIGLEVPQSDLDAFAALFALEPDRLDALVSAVRSCPPTLSARKQAEHVTAQGPFSKDTTLNVLRMLRGAYRVHADLGMPPSELVSIILGEVQRASKERTDLVVDDTRRERVKAALVEALSTTSLGITSQGMLTVRAADKSWCNAKVISDLRPLFLSDKASVPAALAVSHTLQITMHTAAAHNESLSVRLQASDLRELKRVIEVALERDASVSQMAEKTDLPVVNDDDVHSDEGS